jgi:hypothetical protein
MLPWWQLIERKLKMEILIFALIAVFRLYQPEEEVIPEPREFQPFDVQTLQQVFNARVEPARRAPDRRKSYRVEAAS